MKRHNLTAALAAAVTMMAAPVYAQVNPCGVNGTTTAGTGTNICYVEVNASATVHDVMSLTLNTTTLGLGTPVETDYDNGYKNALNTVTATVKANRPWKVTIAAASANFSYNPNGSGLPNPNKSAGDLLWGTDGSTYGNNAGAIAELFSGTTGTATSSQVSHFRTNWSFATGQPGIYSIVLNYTLATP